MLTFPCAEKRQNNPLCRLEFDGMFRTPGDIRVELIRTTIVTCSAYGGDPEPSIFGKIVDEWGDFVKDLEENEGISQAREMMNGVSKSFVFFPSLEDDGKRVVCEAHQDGFDSQSIERTIKVVFQPQDVPSRGPYHFMVNFNK